MSVSRTVRVPVSRSSWGTYATVPYDIFVAWPLTRMSPERDRLRWVRPASTSNNVVLPAMHSAASRPGNVSAAMALPTAARAVGPERSLQLNTPVGQDTQPLTGLRVTPRGWFVRAQARGDISSIKHRTQIDRTNTDAQGRTFNGSHLNRTAPSEQALALAQHSLRHCRGVSWVLCPFSWPSAHAVRVGARARNI